VPAVRRQEIIRLTEQITAATMRGDFDLFTYVVIVNKQTLKISVLVNG